jgi:diguanylate cyclase (GGDEF)-like protein
MNLGRKLFLAFISASLFGITLFGYITYQTTRNAQLEELASSTSASAQQLATLLAGQNNEQIQSSLQQLVSRKHDTPYDVVVTDQQGKVVFVVNRQINADFIDSLIKNEPASNYTEVGKHYLLWSIQDIPDTNLKLYLLRKLEKSGFGSFIKSSGVPLIIASLILLWLAIWGAMILTSLYRRLETQRQELEYQTLHDGLTDLPNRTCLVEQTEERLKKPLPNGKSHAMVVLDINRLKEINDTLGHYAGDTLLCMVANRLRNIIRGDDILARIVSDEFALLLTGVTQEVALAVTSRIQDSLNEGFKLDGHEFYLGASIGIAFYPDHALDAISLIKQGELAMYAAKNIGIGITIYDQTHNTSTLEQLKLVNDLRTDLENKNIRLYFQPKMDLHSGQPVSLEALARWEHPDHGHIATSRFIHIAENTGLINPLTYWVMEHAMQRSQQLQERGLRLNMAINLSVWNLQDLEIVDYLRSLLEQHDIEPSRVTLEITETAMMVNQKRALSTLNQLHRLGVNLSIDDFGTGYSSLAYLKRLPLNEVKIDKSFVKSMRNQSSDSSMVRAIIDLAHDLNLNVVAEGAESGDIVKILQELDCDQAQGSYYANAMPFDDLIEWLNQFGKKQAVN